MPRVLAPGGSPLLVRVAAGGDAHGGGECEEEKARPASRENAARRGGVREARRRSTSKRGSPSK